MITVYEEQSSRLPNTVRFLAPSRESDTRCVFVRIPFVTATSDKAGAREEYIPKLLMSRNADFPLHARSRPDSIKKFRERVPAL